MKYSVIRTELDGYLTMSRVFTSSSYCRKVGTYKTETGADCAIQRFVTKFFEKESVRYERMNYNLVKDIDKYGNIKYVMWNIIKER